MKQLLVAQLQSANDLLKNYGSCRIEPPKLYSVSHLSGHQKNKCKNTALKGSSFVTIEIIIPDSVQKSKTLRK